MLNSGEGDVDTHTPMGLMLLTVMVALAHMKLEIEGERITDLVVEHRTVGIDLGGLRPTFSDSHRRNASRLIQAREPAIQVAGDHKMSKPTLCRCIREPPRPTI